MVTERHACEQLAHCPAITQCMPPTVANINKSGRLWLSDKNIELLIVVQQNVL